MVFWGKLVAWVIGAGSRSGKSARQVALLLHALGHRSEEGENIGEEGSEEREEEDDEGEEKEGSGKGGVRVRLGVEASRGRRCEMAHR